MRCEEAQELLEREMTGSLGERDAARLAEHVDSCRECRSLQAAYRQGGQTLTEALAAGPGLTPPEALKQRVLGAVSQGEGREARWALERGMERRTAAWWPRRLTRPAVVAAAVGALLIVGSLAWGAAVSVTLARERNVRAELAALLGKQETLLEVVDSSRTLKVMLRAQEPGSDSYGKLYTRSDLSDVVAMAGKLRPPAEGEAYYLWLTGGGVTELAAEMTVNEDGFGLAVFRAPAPGPKYDAAVVTRQTSRTDAPLGVTVIAWKKQ